MPDVTFERGHTAVLIADFYAEMMDTLPHATGRGVVQKASAIQAAARDAGVMVCYCATVFRPGYPEIGQRNKTFSQRKASGQTAIPNPIDVIHSGVRPHDDEVVVGKHRVNALYGTGLDLALRANDIRDLVILGYATSGVILSTVRYAADLDYNLYVVEDCCSDPDVEVHGFLVDRILPRQADIVQSDDVIQALRTL
jgi:nicotinamidase-related amidase